MSRVFLETCCSLHSWRLHWKVIMLLLFILRKEKILSRDMASHSAMTSSGFFSNTENSGRHIFQGRPQYIQITNTNMYLLNERRHNINIQCHGNYIIMLLLCMYVITSLTHSCLGIFISLTKVVWTLDTFENNFKINYRLKKIFEGELWAGF